MMGCPRRRRVGLLGLSGQDRSESRKFDFVRPIQPRLRSAWSGDKLRLAITGGIVRWERGCEGVSEWRNMMVLGRQKKKCREVCLPKKSRGRDVTDGLWLDVQRGQWLDPT